MSDEQKLPKVAQRSPYVIDLEPGRYAWCACGLSTSQPFCDGSHKDTGLAPVVFEVEEERKAALCGCKRTRSGDAFCDGTHSKLDD